MRARSSPCHHSVPGLLLLRTAVLAACLSLVPGTGRTIRADVPPLPGSTDKGAAELPAELKQADEALRRGDFPRTMALLEEASKKSPQLSPPPLLLARVLVAHGSVPAGARSVLENLAVKHPDDPAVYIAFGQLSLAEGRITEASVLFARARSLCDPGKQHPVCLRECYSGQAAVAERRRDWLAAEQVLTTWLALERDNAEAHQRLGRAHFFLGKPDEAFAELEKAVRANPKLDLPAVTMARFASQKGAQNEAEQWLERAVKEKPQDARVRLAFAIWLLEQGRPEEAATQDEAALGLVNDSLEGRRLQGLIARYQGKSEEAERIFETLHRESPTDFFASNQLALTLAEQGNLVKQQRAVELAAANARQYSRSSEALATLGRALYKVGKWDQAEQVLNGALKLGTLSRDAVYYLAVVRDSLARPEEDTRKLLQAALGATGQFLHRKEAQELLARLDKGKR